MSQHLNMYDQSDFIHKRKLSDTDTNDKKDALCAHVGLKTQLK